MSTKTETLGSQIMANFGDALDTIMNERGISQTELAQKSGISLSNVCHTVHGRRNNPNLETLRKIIKALPADIDLRKLLL